MTCSCGKKEEDEYYPGHAGYNSSVGRRRDEDGMFTSNPQEDEYECEEDEDYEPLCDCYTRRPIDQ